MITSFSPKEFLESGERTIEEIISHADCSTLQAVLGIDIYRYSEYPKGAQEYIPVLFDELFRSALSSCISNEELLFQKSGLSIDHPYDFFISTGDGGFFILDNPMLAVVFSVYFQAVVTIFNNGQSNNVLFVNLRQIIKRIDLRYSITYGDIYKYANNFYGIAIIKNARILSKDRLNRMLIDETCMSWFSSEINSLENMQILEPFDLRSLNFLAGYDLTKKTLLIKEKSKNNIVSVEVQRLERLSSKNFELEIYNCRIQVKLKYNGLSDKKYQRILITVGNLNVSGINT
ncbi:MAG: hypothetical protein PHR62_10185 [Paludibacter sp.]|nr:hypothetical protein [Paludibacter sp.]